MYKGIDGISTIKQYVSILYHPSFTIKITLKNMTILEENSHK